MGETGRSGISPGSCVSRGGARGSSEFDVMRPAGRWREVHPRIAFSAICVQPALPEIAAIRRGGVMPKRPAFSLIIPGADVAGGYVDADFRFQASSNIISPDFVPSVAFCLRFCKLREGGGLS